MWLSAFISSKMTADSSQCVCVNVHSRFNMFRFLQFSHKELLTPLNPEMIEVPTCFQNDKEQAGEQHAKQLEIAHRCANAFPSQWHSTMTQSA